MESKKVALITGCSSGFGFLTALKFAREGYQVFAGIRNLESQGAKELWEIKKKENLPLEILPLDVTSQLSVEEAVQMTINKAGRIDVLVNNAGFGFTGPVEEFSIDEVKEQYETNVYGVLRMVKAVVPTMRTQGEGLIINISSIAGLVSTPLLGVYSSSKFAVESLSEALRFELSAFGIRLVLVEPGSFATNFKNNLKSVSTKKSQSGFYSRLTNNSKKVVPRSVSQVNNSRKVADLIYKISQEKNPRLRYLVGLDAHLYYLLKKLLPQRLWELFLHKIYNW